jgi:hypothetical protein
MHRIRAMMDSRNTKGQSLKSGVAAPAWLSA